MCAVIWSIAPGQVNKLGNKHPGFCAGMTILWILLRKRNEDFKTRKGIKDIFVSLTDEHVALIQKYQEVRVDGGVESYAQALGGRIDKTFTAKAVNGEYETNDLRSIADNVCKKTDRFRSTIIGNTPTCFFLVRFSQGR